MDEITGIGKGITRLVEYGVIGVVLALALVALAYLYRELRALNAARVEELRKTEQTITGIIAQIETVSRENSARLKDSVERFNMTMNAHSTALETNTKILTTRNETMLTVERAIADWVKVTQASRDDLSETLEAIHRQVAKLRPPKE